MAKKRRTTRSVRKPKASVELVEIVSTRATPGARWQPVVGPETLGLLKNLDLPSDNKEEREARIRDEAARILARCVPPMETSGSEIGLVVGYVQSGKTMSFTTVAALARDNGYQMVIAITGTSVPLLEQSTERLVKDLRLASRKDRKWQHFPSPKPDGQDRINIMNTLADWDDKEVPRHECKTVLITVMKQHTHLDDLIAVLSNMPLDGRPVLVIDDEADQAGLNTWVRRGDESATYRRLLSLRRCLPHHSYLQYTATPQAPLLINLIDVLSPRFAEVLEPGPEYVGGRDFFSSPGLVRAIPETEIPSESNELEEPPESLLVALRLYLLGVAAGLIREQGRGNRSMLVHPSQRTLAHGQYFKWVSTVVRQWGAILDLPGNDSDRKEVVTDFRSAYVDLRATVPDLPSFEELSRRLKHAIRQMRIEEVNAVGGRTPQIGWSAAYPQVLVGGQAMDRGFTVEGLTVTYMPRGLGVGNADNVQQRARFLGYKRRYMGYCRVFLENAVRDAYRNYVSHEEDIRARLIAHRDSGRLLTEWKREFFLTNKLKPTRRSVLGLDYMRLRLGEQWWSAEAPHDTQEAVEANREIVDAFVRSLSLVPDKGHRDRTKQQRHLVDQKVKLSVAFESLLTQFRVTAPDDSQKFTAILIQIRDFLETNPRAECSVYVMSGGAIRDRGLDEKGHIKNLFQGANPDRTGAIYPGDRSIRAGRGLTIQVHRLNVDAGGQSVAEDVPVIAVWVPGEMAQDLIVQDQPQPT